MKEKEFNKAKANPRSLFDKRRAMADDSVFA